MSDPFRHELNGLLRHSPDPRLHDAVWTYLEGGMTRRELRLTPAYQRVVGDYYRSRFADLQRAGLDVGRLRAEARAVVEADDDRDGTAYADQVLPPPD